VFVVGPLLNMTVPFLVAANILAVLLIAALNVIFIVSLKRVKGITRNEEH
jgi:hypothetical protein